MSGHSKWNNIKRKKEKADGAKAKVFTKIGRELAVAVKEGGSADPAANSRLRDCIAKAKAANVPNDNIERIIKKAAGEGNANSFEDVTYEGYGPSGVAVIVEALTDNRNRTAADVRHAFDKFGGNLGTTGCVSFMFNKKGVIVVEREGLDDDPVMSDALDVYKRQRLGCGLSGSGLCVLCQIFLLCGELFCCDRRRIYPSGAVLSVQVIGWCG